MHTTIANAPMTQFLPSSGSLRSTLPAELTRRVGEIVVHNGGVFFADDLAANPHLVADQRLDLVGKEATINLVHLDTFSTGILGTDAWAREQVAMALLFGELVLRQCASVTDLPIEVVFSLDLGPDSGPASAFRFYGLRDGIAWSDHPDRYAQPVFSMRAERI